MKLLELKYLQEGADLSASELMKNNAVTGEPRIDIFLKKINAGEPFPTVSGSPESVTIDKSEIERFKSLLAAGPLTGRVSVKTDKGNVSLSSLKKTGDFGGLSGEVAGKIGNRGDIAEGILGAALFAKMKARVGGGIKVINPAMVWDVIDSLQLQKVVTAKEKENTYGEYTVKVKDVNQTSVKDSIMFTLKLKQGPFTEIMDLKKRSLLTSEVSGAVEYANSPDAEEFATFFYLNGKPDIIHVITDGLSDQTGKKSDIEVIVTDPKTGKVHQQQLNISLKAGSEQFAQVSGGSDISAVGKSLLDTQKELWGYFGVEIDPLADEFNEIIKKQGMESAIQFMYTIAGQHLKDLLSGNIDDEEYMYIKDFVNAVNFFATRNTPNIVLVNLKKGGYTISSFDDLASKIADIDLDARYRQQPGGLPIIEIFDANSGTLFMQIRSYRTKKLSKEGKKGFYYRNYIEKGPLLGELTDIKRTK